MMAAKQICHALNILIVIVLFYEALTASQITVTAQETSATECPNSTSSELNWRSFEDSCYSANTVSLFSYEAGNEFCRRNGGALASIHSTSEMQFIMTLVGTNTDRFWVGLRKSYPDKYKWEDGTTADFLGQSIDDDSSFLEYADIYDLDVVDSCVSFKPPTDSWLQDSCDSAYHVICKYRRPSGVSPTVTTPLAFCPDGWYTFGDSCYKVGGRSFGEKKSWSGASDQCEDMGSQLISVHSAREQDFLNTLMVDVRSRMWIGLSRASSRDDFIWKDNTPLDYSNWNEGEPNNHLDTEENCVQLLEQPRELGKWNDAPCRLKFPYICKKLRDPTITHPGRDPSFCTEPEGWLKIRDSCYKVFNEVQSPMSWLEAQYACANSSAILASVKNFQVTAELRPHMKEMYGYFWIGIRSTPKHAYTWIGGAPLVYSNWQKDQPRDVTDENNCVAVNTQGEWMVRNCNETLPFICEVNEAAPEPPTLPPPSGKMTCPQFSPKWHDFGGKYCYIIEVERKIQSYEASCLCTKEGGFLASFHSSDEIDLLIHYLKEVSVSLHIGFERNRRGSFVWTDGSAADFDNWNTGEPNSDREQCTAMRTSTGKWNNIHCSERHGYICSVPKVPEKKSDLIEKSESPLPSSVARIGEQHSGTTIAVATVCTVSVLIIAAVSMCYYYPSLRNKVTGKIPFGKFAS